jgi:hypothetical protein
MMTLLLVYFAYFLDGPVANPYNRYGKKNHVGVAELADAHV